jgi:hypothetical protein
VRDLTLGDDELFTRAVERPESFPD